MAADPMAALQYLSIGRFYMTRPRPVLRWVFVPVRQVCFFTLLSNFGQAWVFTTGPPHHYYLPTTPRTRQIWSLNNPRTLSLLALSTAHAEYEEVEPISTLLGDEPPVCLSPGTHEGFCITHEYEAIPPQGLSLEFGTAEQLPTGTIERLQLTPTNLTMPVALMLLDPTQYPSLSKARKALRQGKICYSTEQVTTITTANPHQQSITIDHTTLLPIKAKVGDWVFPGTVVCQQQRVSHGRYSELISHRPLPVEVPVVYEDDIFAIVHKPPGMLVYSTEQGYQRNTLKHTLPYILTPPPLQQLQHNNDTALERLELCHRLDKPTGGLVVVAKTKRAVVHLSRQFEDRLIQKTYTAILNGKLVPPSSTTVANTTTKSGDDREGGTIETSSSSSSTSQQDQEEWHLAENTMDGKHAVTLWRVLRYQPSPLAQNQTLTVVELQPKTGRYHQLRRHMAWIYGCPIVGDPIYGGQLPDGKRYGRGLLLCATKIRVEHPYWSTNSDDSNNQQERWVDAAITVPDKFESLLAAHENKWRYRDTEVQKGNIY